MMVRQQLQLAPAPVALGEITEAFDLQSYREQAWVTLTTYEGAPEALAGTEQLASNAEVAGVRLVRRRTLVSYQFVEGLVVFRRLAPEVIDASPLWQPELAPEVRLWRQPAQLSADPARDELRPLLGRFLEERRLSVIELLHGDQHMKALDGAGTLLQGVLQKVAPAQARLLKSSTPTVFKELMALMGQLSAQLHAEAERERPLPLAPGRFAATCRTLEQRHGANSSYHAWRALSAFLADAGSWLEKLDRLGQLIEGGLTPADLSLLDTVASDLMASAGLWREALGDQGNRLALMMALVDFLTGQGWSRAPAQRVGVRALGELALCGGLPRTRFQVRRRLLRELYARQSLSPSGDLMADLTAQDSLFARMLGGDPAFAADAEIVVALEDRARRGLTPEAVAQVYGSSSSAITERIERIQRLVRLVPGNTNKGLVFQQLRRVQAPEDVVRQCQREGGARGAALPLLADLHRALTAAAVDDPARNEFIDAVDQALLEVLQRDLLAPGRRPSLERFGQLIELCGRIGPGSGKARALVVETLVRDIRTPKLLPSFLGRLKNDDERKDAMIRLHAFLASGEPPERPPGPQ